MSSISIDKIMVRPYDPSSKISSDFPGYDHFDDRSDFILFGDMSHIAVYCKPDYMATEYDADNVASENYTADLYDTTHGKIIASKNFTATMYRLLELEDDILRVDIPVKAHMVNTYTEYAVRLRKGKSRKVICQKPVLFFKIDKMPTKCITFEKACIFYKGTIYKHLNYDHAGEAYVRFSIDEIDFESYERPELWLCLYDGNRIIKKILGEYEYCAPYNYDDEDFDQTDYWVDFTITPGTDLTNVNYAEVQLFGFGISGVIISGIVGDVKGEYSASELTLRKDFTERQWQELLNTRILHEYEKKMEEKQDVSNEDEFDKLLEELELYIEEDEKKEEPQEAEESDEQQKFDSLVGLESVKAKFNQYANLIRFNQLRKEAGLPYAMPPLHALFLGSPGTGKTTVAEIMGKMLHDIGVLSKGHVVKRERSTLLGQFYSSEAEKTREALEEAQGGILFIDEAYQLYQESDPKDPGKFVLETLMTALADENNRDWMLILAGYTEPTKKLLMMNPGLSSRIPEANHYIFEDFSTEQLTEIAHNYLESNQYKLTPEADKALTDLLEHDFRNKAENFGNARHVMNIIQTGIIPSMATRISKIEAPSEEDLTTILLCDIPKPTANNNTPDRRIGFSRTPRMSA